MRPDTPDTQQDVVDGIGPLAKNETSGTSSCVLLHRLIREDNFAAVVMISANHPQEEVNRRHLIAPEKPFELDDLLATLHTALLDKRPQ
jgi:hypothetical protein